MFSFVSFRVPSRIISFSRLLMDINRFHSTKLTHAPSAHPQEFCLDTYDCVGFDLDHTLCRYRLKPLFHLIYGTLATFLVEKKGYPCALKQPGEADLQFAQKGIVLDKCRGNFLKLDAGYHIVRATHGTRLLSNEDVEQVYGSERIWEDAQGVPGKLVGSRAMREPFYVFKDYFVTAGAVLCARIVDLLDEREGRCLPSYSFWDDYLEGIFHMYDRDNFRNCSGGFYPELKRHPELYLRTCSQSVKDWLRSVRRDKMVFLLTSSNYDSAEFIAEYCLGKDWKEYFDIVVTFAKKPGFFWKDKPFCRVSEGVEVADVKPESMGTHSMYSQGNFKGLQEACAALTKTKHPKTVYFGDSLIEDIYAASEVAGCDTVAIVEEMLPEEELLVSDFWSSFFSNGSAFSGNPVDNLSLWAHLLSQHSKLAIPNLESLSVLPIGEKITCFGGDSPLSGYFPCVPKALSS